MNPVRRKRLALVLIVVLGVGAAVALTVTAFNQNMLFFYTPSQLADAELQAERNVRLGGMVVDDSVQREDNGVDVRFEITDEVDVVPVVYTGILPDLFREGQGVVALGRLRADGVFVAEEVLAKHDENYMPPELAEEMEKVHREQAEETTKLP